MIITTIRHGHTLWNGERRMQGHTDIPLSPIGLTQGEKVAARLVDVPRDIIYSCDLLRAAKTAEMIGGGSAEIITTAALREKGFGVFEGMVYEEARRQMNEYDRLGQAWPGAETRDEFRGRVNCFLDEVVASNHQHVFIVSHGGTILAIICYLLGLTDFRADYSVGNTALHRFKRVDGMFVMTTENDSSHLDA